MAQNDVQQHKREYRQFSGWPNVKEAFAEREAKAKEEAMLAAGAKLAETAKRGPGRPPRSSYASDSVDD